MDYNRRREISIVKAPPDSRTKYELGIYGGREKQRVGCSLESSQTRNETDMGCGRGTPTVGVFQVLGILGEYEREHPGAVQRFQQSQAEVDRRLVQQALRREEHQLARFVQEAERARYIKNFQARQLIKRALRRQTQQQAAAKYEQYQAQARRLTLERERLEQVKNKILTAMKQRGEEEKAWGLAMASESVHGPAVTRGLGHPTNPPVEFHRLHEPSDPHLLEPADKLSARGPSTPLHSVTSPEEPTSEASQSISSILPDYAHNQPVQHSPWIFSNMERTHPVIASDDQLTPTMSLKPKETRSTAEHSSTDNGTSLLAVNSPVSKAVEESALLHESQMQAKSSATSLDDTREGDSTSPPYLPDKVPDHRPCARSAETRDGSHATQGVKQSESNQGNRPCSLGGCDIFRKGGCGIADQKPTEDPEKDYESLWGEFRTQAAATISTSYPNTQGRPHQSTCNPGFSGLQDLGLAQGPSRTVVKPWWRKRGLKESGLNSGRDHRDKTCGCFIVEDPTPKQTPMNTPPQRIPTGLHGTHPQTPPLVKYISSIKHRGNETPRGGTGRESRVATKSRHSREERQSLESHMAPAPGHELKPSGQKLGQRRRTLSLSPHAHTHHHSELFGLHAGVEDQAAAEGLWQGSTCDDRTLPTLEPTLRCPSPKETPPIAVNDDFHCCSHSMHTSDPPRSQHNAPSFRLLEAASREDSARTTPGIFHAADTVQIAGGTFTTAGTVTNITYSVTVPSRSCLPSIPLSSWFNRVKSL